MTRAPDLTVVDLVPVFAHLDFLENLIQEGGYEAAAAHLFSYPVRGEPLMQGNDPISAYLNDAAPPEARIETGRDALLIVLYRGPTSRTVATRAWFELDSHPGVNGFVYCIEDLRFPELSPPQ
jgi:hypothetical protein